MERKNYDLEERTFRFTQHTAAYVNNLPKYLSNLKFGEQLIRAAGSVGSNYIEANESLSRRDFLMRVKISKKESKESRYWLKLTAPNRDSLPEQQRLIQEATELMKIFGSIIEKSQ